MNTADIIGVFNVLAQVAVAVVAIVAVVASLRANKKQIESSDKQLKEQIKASEIQIQKQIEENRRLATEERQQQSCPIIVPTKAIAKVPAEEVLGTQQLYLYTSEALPLKANISWDYSFYLFR